MRRQEARRLGMAGPAQRVEVRHACGHTMRWDFFGRVDARRKLASQARCAVCEGEAPFPCDVVWPGTGVCHAHVGPCPDSPHDPFLASVDARVKRGGVLLN